MSLDNVSQVGQTRLSFCHLDPDLWQGPLAGLTGPRKRKLYTNTHINCQAPTMYQVQGLALPRPSHLIPRKILGFTYINTGFTYKSM